MKMPKLNLQVVLLAVLVAGVVLICVSAAHLLPFGWMNEIVKELGVAALIAAVLGFTVDKWLKGELARDAFEGAMGYVLPSELRREVQRISTYKMLCEKHHMHITIEAQDSDIVKVTSMCERTLRNISLEEVDVDWSVHIDEWGFPGKRSEIIECEIKVGNGKSRSFDPQKTTFENSTVRANIEPLKLTPDDTATVAWKIVEYRRRNDLVHVNFSWPTRNPRIQVTMPSSLKGGAYFRSGYASEKLKYSDTYELQGTYLPSQSMGARWWPR